MITAGIIGLGRMGAEPSKRLKGQVPNGWIPVSHLESLMANDIAITKICDLNEDRMNWVKSNYKINPRTYNKVKDFFEDSPVDLVSIATRTPQKPEILREAISAKTKGIVVEKPFANSMTETVEILRKAAEANCIIGYGATRRAMSIYRMAKELAQSGNYGELISITAEFGRSKLLWSYPHIIDLFLFYACSSEVEYVQGNCSISEDENFLDINYFDGDPIVESGIVKFKNGIIANVTPIGGMNIRLGLSKGVITIHGNGDYIEINTSKKFASYYNKSRKIFAQHSNSGTVNTYKAIKEALEYGYRFDLITLGEIEANQRILFSIFQSSLNYGKRLSFEDINSDLIISGRSGKLYA